MERGTLHAELATAGTGYFVLLAMQTIGRIHGTNRGVGIAHTITLAWMFRRHGIRGSIVDVMLSEQKNTHTWSVVYRFGSELVTRAETFTQHKSTRAWYCGRERIVGPTMNELDLV